MNQWQRPRADPVGNLRRVGPKEADDLLGSAAVEKGPLAAFVVKSLPLEAIRWGVVVVVLYAAVVLLRAALKPEPTAAPEAVLP